MQFPSYQIDAGAAGASEADMRMREQAIAGGGAPSSPRLQVPAVAHAQARARVHGGCIVPITRAIADPGAPNAALIISHAFWRETVAKLPRQLHGQQPADAPDPSDRLAGAVAGRVKPAGLFVKLPVALLEAR